jgi:predicted lipoprotein with Yx(FWY)xxD motif
VLAIAPAALSACGGGEEEETRADCAESPESKKDIVVIVAEVEEVGEVLALADCTPLYVNDVDTAKRVQCTGECARVWTPLRAPKGGSVTTHSPVPIAPVTFANRPDGLRQAVIDGKPLYTYSRESETGASGDAVTDSFGGAQFSWSVVSSGDVPPGPAGGQPQGGQPPPGGQPSP